VATGKVTAAHKKRRRRVEFLDFMNDVVAAYPDTAIHVVLDTTSPRMTGGSSVTRTCSSTSRRRGFLAQPSGDLVLDPARKVSARRLFHLGQSAQGVIDAFIDAYNETAKPFVWTKSKVHQKRLKPRFGISDSGY
jgi:hypothetical protein